MPPNQFIETRTTRRAARAPPHRSRQQAAGKGTPPSRVAGGCRTTSGLVLHEPSDRVRDARPGALRAHMARRAQEAPASILRSWVVPHCWNYCNIYFDTLYRRIRRLLTYPGPSTRDINKHSTSRNDELNASRPREQTPPATDKLATPSAPAPPRQHRAAPSRPHPTHHPAVPPHPAGAPHLEQPPNPSSRCIQPSPPNVLEYGAAPHPLRQCPPPTLSAGAPPRGTLLGPLS